MNTNVDYSQTLIHYIRLILYDPARNSQNLKYTQRWQAIMNFKLPNVLYVPIVMLDFSIYLHNIYK